ncbi:MAG: fibronectin type III domain-containing protein [Gemmatimonadales bacterium]
MKRRLLPVVVGAVALTALACKDSPTEPGTRIALGSITMAFSATAGGANPGCLTVAIANGGGGSLTGLAITIAYGTGQPTGWLTATLDRTAAPATLTLCAAIETLPAGTYGATVAVSSAAADNSPQPVTVTLTVGPPVVASVVVSPAGGTIATAGGTRAFSAEARTASGGAIEGKTFTWTSLNPNVATISGATGVAAAVASGQVTIAATTDGVTGYALLTVTMPGTTRVTQWSPVATGAAGSLNHVWGTSAANVLAVGDNGQILRYAGTGWTPMPSGTSQWLYGVWGSSASNVYAVGLGGSVRRFDGTGWNGVAVGVSDNLMAVWGSAPNDIFVVGNGGRILHYDGTSWVPMASPTTEDLFGIWGASATDVHAVGRSGTLLHFNGSSWASVSPGVTVNLIGVWGAGGSDVFVVGGVTTVLRYNGTTWSAGNTGINVGATGVWGTSTSDVYAAGTGGSDPIVRYDGTGWSQMTVGFPGVLEEIWGTLGGDVWAVGSGGTILRGIRGPLIDLTSVSVTFGGTQGGADPAAQTVSVTNGGGGTLSGLAVGTIAYGTGQPTGWLSATLDQTAAPAVLTLQATTGTLPPASYTAVVPVTSAVAANSPQNVSVTFTVAAQPEIALDRATVIFDDVVAGGADPGAHAVAVTNSGGGTLSGLAVGTIIYGTGEPADWLAATLDQTTAPATLTLQATTGTLGAGTYTAAVPITSAVAANSPQIVTVTFTVVAPPTIALNPATVTFDAAVAGGPDPGVQTVAVTNGGGGTLGGLAVGTITYGTAQPTDWLAATLDRTTAPATLTLRATTGTLPAGTYDATVPVTSPDASNSPHTVNATLTVNAAPAPDLTVTGLNGAALTVTPTSVIQGGTATISSHTVRNLGTAASGPLDVGYYLSTDPALSSADTRLTGFTHPSLEAGASINYGTLPLTIPASTPPGAYHIGVLVDGPGAVSESNEGNNSASTALSVTQPPPAAPSDLAANAASPSAIDLSWTDHASNETGFKIERCSPGFFGCGGTLGAPFDQIATVGANVTSYRSAGLLASTSYTYRVRAYNAGGNSSYSNQASATTQAAGTPPAPSGLVATAVSIGQINLSWTDNATSEDGFRLERCTGATCTNFAEVATVAANITTYQNTGLGEGTTYRYRVRAYNATGPSAYSSAAAAATQTSPVPPAAPSGLVATPASASRIDLSWTDHATNEAGFRIESCFGGPGGGVYACASTEWFEIALVEANVTSYQHTGLFSSTTYLYRVRAYNSAGNSAYSNEVQTTTLSVPRAPSGLVVTAVYHDWINMSWTDNATDETGFEIERCTGAPCTDAFRYVASVGANVTAFLNDRLVDGTTYSYRVRAFNANGNSGYSNIATGTTQAILAPSGLGATPISGGQINLSWTDNATNEAGYRIERCTGAACTTFSQIATVGVNVTSYASTGLSAGTTYSYRVRAYTGSNVSDYSNTATATTNPLVAPSALVATAVSASQINLSWTDNGSGEAGFKIERCAGAGCTNFVQIGGTFANVTSYQNTGLAAATTYSYRVRAYTATANSAYSNIATATTH